MDKSVGSLATEAGRSLHIGCGPNYKDADVGIDLLPGPAVDIVHDLEETPWPMTDNEFDLIICKDVLEHLTNIPATMKEIHRIARDGAKVQIQVPSGTSPDVFTDPTHIRGFSFQSFDYFDSEKPKYAYGYSDIDVRVTSFEFVGLNTRPMRWLDQVLAKFANRHPGFYESRLCQLFPMRALRFELTVRK